MLNTDRQPWLQTPSVHTRDFWKFVNVASEWASNCRDSLLQR
jgi:hypothetical protein